MFDSFVHLSTESIFFIENFNIKQSYFDFTNHSFFFFLTDLPDFSTASFDNLNNVRLQSLLNFINQTEDLSVFSNLENVQTIYHYSIPTTKLAYPEPFIASASLMHNDLWFVHILIYQYWLWFVFVFIIVFFFIGFITTVRWCNMRVRPRRETRGVSRSKCGDLVTATVPVSWAASIIISESTDAIDYYDGFGTTELVVGIRAYQWGWEYYYPKDLDLNYNLRPNYSSFIGNSLKYNSSSELSLRSNNPWRFYQNKTTDAVITPAHLLVLPTDNYKILNFLNFNDIGSNPLSELNAFKKIRGVSKTYTSSLFFTSDEFSSKYRNLGSLYFNSLAYTDSYLYGTKRQQNFLSLRAIGNNNSTFFDLKSLNTLFNFTWRTNLNILPTFYNTSLLNYFNTVDNNQTTFDPLRFNTIFSNFTNNYGISGLNNLYLYPNLLSLLNNDSDKKKFNNPLIKLFSNPSNSLLDKMQDAVTLTDIPLYKNSNFIKNFLFNNQNNYKNFTLSSSNQNVLLAERSIRKFSNISLKSPTLNYTFFLNPINSFYNANIDKLNFTLLNVSENNNLNWPELGFLNKLTANRTYFDFPYIPVPSNNPHISTLDYDNYTNVFSGDTPIILQGKEETVPSFINTAYWNLYFSNSSTDWRFKNNFDYYNFQNSFYFPFFYFYYDYDFRNWQSIELLEDSYWESTQSLYSFDEYFILVNDYNKIEYFDKFDRFYNYRNRDFKFKNSTLLRSFLNNRKLTNKFYTNSLYSDDLISPSELLITSNYFIFPIINSINVTDDSYESIKYLNYFYNNFNKTFLVTSINYFTSFSYSTIFDMFRADYEDFTWFKDGTMSSNFNFFNDIFKFTNSDLLTLFNFNDESFVFNDNAQNDNQTLRFSNYINLRNTVRSSVVTYNAIQKVFRSRFDEGRSNARLIDFSNSYSRHAYLTTPRIQYETLLGKNKESFYKTNFYKTNFVNFLPYFYDSSSSLNFYFFDFPFLLALKSDATRYLWFDWYAKWGFYEVQPSSASRYAIYGMPYFNKSFDFASYGNEAVNETENYLLRLSRARRNYLPNWVYTPYFYAKTTSWYRNNIIYELFNQSENFVTSVDILLSNMNWYWNDLYFINSHNLLFLPSNSNTNSFSKAFWQPSFSIQSYYYNVSTLVDILTKREYLYRQLFSESNKLTNLPFYLTNNPTNPLINDIKSTFLLIDPITYNNEYSRDIYYSSLAFFNFNVIKSIFVDSGEFFGFSKLSNYLFFYFFNDKNNNSLGINSTLFKNTQRPMRRGITNMLRLHATGAVAMPIEIRLQILASSKDIIHSWAIPSAGIKIDCVPGYSSHKVMIFLVSGIFWGQCMEICGRYHHWMPIVVYFMKRDLFFLWCTHFVFLSGANNMWNINDRQYTNYGKVVSYDKSSWVSELNIKL